MLSNVILTGGKNPQSVGPDPDLFYAVLNPAHRKSIAINWVILANGVGILRFAQNDMGGAGA